MRILICPALLPLSRSRRFPGGTRKSSKRPAISSWSSFRRAILSNELKRLTGLPSESVRVSSSAKETITGHIVTDVVNNVKRYYMKQGVYLPGALRSRLVFLCCLLCICLNNLFDQSEGEIWVLFCDGSDVEGLTFLDDDFCATVCEH